jgi:hypothetical protein
MQQTATTRTDMASLRVSVVVGGGGMLKVLHVFVVSSRVVVY